METASLQSTTCDRWFYHDKSTGVFSIAEKSGSLYFNPLTVFYRQLGGCSSPYCRMQQA
jgi:hypothetical protein